MRDAWQGLRRFWTDPVGAERIAVFRIVVGALVGLDTAATLLPHARTFFGPQGLFPTSLYADYLKQSGIWSLLPPDASVTEVRVLLLVLIASAACVAAGLLTRVASIVMWALLVSVHQRNPYVNNSGDLLLQAATLYLVLMPAGAVWSVDSLFRARRFVTTERLVAPWGLRLAQIQLVLVYFFTGLSKLPVPGGPGVGQWISGHALASALAAPTIGRFEALASLPWWVSAPLSWATLAWELTFPLLVLRERSRVAALAFGVILHLGIFATLEVHTFSFVALAYYVLLVPERWLRRSR